MKRDAHVIELVPGRDVCGPVLEPGELPGDPAAVFMIGVMPADQSV